MPFGHFAGGSTRKGGFSSFLNKQQSKQDPYSNEAIGKQIENAKLRIKDSGFNPDEEQHNWFEKLTNLPKNQNWFFDTLELIGRPGTAVLNAIDKGIDGGDVGEAAWRGFSGKDRITGSDFAQDKLGIDNKVGKFVTGLAIDVATDPTNLIPGKVYAGAARSLGNGAKTAYNAVENVSPGFVKAGREAAQETLGKAFKYQYGWDRTLQGAKSDDLKKAFDFTKNDANFRTEEALKNLTGVARSTGLESGSMVGRMMEKDLKQYIPTDAYKFGDEVLESKQDALNLLKDFKANKRSEIANIGKSITSETKDYKQTQQGLLDALKSTNKEIDKLYFGLEKGTKNEFKTAFRDNVKDAKQSIKEIDNQILDLDRSVKSLQKHYKNEVISNHTKQFDIVNKLKELAPNGIKGLPKKEVSSALWPLLRNGGKAIDEVANELGYKYADDLVNDLKALPSKKIDPALVSTRAKNLSKDYINKVEKQKKSLLQAKESILKSLDEVSPASDKEVISESFKKLAENPQYQQLKVQKDVLTKQLKEIPEQTKVEKKAKIEQIQVLQKEMKNTKVEPTTIQKEHVRPTREMSTDQKIKEAAEKLTQSNNSIREWAQSNGVDVKELEGYMRHVWSKEERELRKKKQTFAIDRGNRGTGSPNKKVLNPRELLGSVEDINEQVGRNLFEPNAYFATAQGQQRLIEYVSAVKFRDTVLKDKRFAQKYEKGMDIPPGAVKIDITNYKFLRPGFEDLDKTVGEYIVTKGAKEALDRYQRLATDEGVKGMLKAFDTAQNFWKKFALFSVGYHVRNLVGAMVNNYVGGMSELAVGKYTVSAAKEVMDSIKGKESALFREYRQQGLGSSNLSKIEFKVNDDPESMIENIVKERSRSKKGQVMARLNPLRSFETSRELGDVMDQTNRFALYKWARDKGMNPEEAAAKVREVQFDYSRTTQWEKEVMTRTFPFYRWMRNNVPFQIQSFINDPRKINRLNDVRLNAQSATGVDDENVPDWMKNSFAISNVFDPSTENGKGSFISMNLPVGDLTKLSEPGKMFVDSASPLLKLPAELSMNRNFFYDKPIEKFEGQEKQFQIPGTNIDFGIPVKAAYALEQTTGQIGRGFSQYLQKPDQEDLDTKFRMPSLGISSLTKPFDVEQAKKYQLLNELKKLQDQIMYIEQQTGNKPRTVNEIKR